MARGRVKAASGPPGETILDVDVSAEMQGSFLEYAYSVIYSRALPDARDGLKPVQRRILYQMAQMGLRPDRGHVKSARVVGEVMGRLHPHGDGAIYDALVRMAQPFTLRLPMVDGHGNFGSLDDGPAAMRYCLTGETRVRLADGSSPRIADLVGLAADGERELDVLVMDKDGKPVRASKGFHSGTHPVYRVSTATGHSITGTANHPLLCLVAPAGVPMLAWLQIDEITPGTYVCLSRETAPGSVPTPGEWQLGVLCGAWVSEGWANSTRAGFNNTDQEFFNHVLAAYDAVVGGTRYLAKQTLRRSGKTLYALDVQQMAAFHASPLASLVGQRSADKQIPEAVWNGGLAVKRAFLMAAFEGDGSFNRGPAEGYTIHYSTRSERLCSEIQELLLDFGVASSRFLYRSREEYRVIISGRHNVRRFALNVGFLTAKQRLMEQYLTNVPSTTHRLSGDFVPFVRQYLESTLAPRRGSGRHWLLNHNIDRVERWATERSLILSRIKDPEMARVLLNVMDTGYRYVQVTSVTGEGAAPVFSLRVDSEDHSFIAGGFVNHNTECRLAPPALDMTATIDEDTVDFEPNYDGRELEPAVLPSAIPNLLVNGASGIAVGMATNMAPHNLGEVVAAARHLLADPGATVEDLMRFVPGPDLPNGGLIVGLDGIRQAYETGRGAFRIRATTRIEQVSPRRQGIVITSLPHVTGPERVIERVKELVLAKKLNGISNLTDLTDAEHGLRLVVEVKSGFNPNAVLAQLFKLTPMEDQFSINNVALVAGRPQTLGLKGLLQVYLDHRVEVVRRRSEFRRTRAAERLHLVEGLLIAILDIDEVIAIIRGSDDTAMARHRLMAAFELTEVQTNYILEMPLRRLTKFSRIELESEADDLRRTIETLTRVLEDPEELNALVSAELAEVAERHADPRRTILLESDGAEHIAAVETPLEVPDEPCWVLMSSTGLLARTTSGEPPAGAGPRAKHDCIVGAVAATARGHVGIVGSDGLVRRLNVVELPALAPAAGPPALSGGTPIGALLDVPKGVSVVGLVALTGTIAMGTRDGVVKRLVMEDVPSRPAWDLIRLGDGDRLVAAVPAPAEDHHLVLISESGQLLRFPAGSVRPQGRAAGGMAGIKLAPGDSVIFFGTLDPRGDGEVVTIAGSGEALPGTSPGTGKVTVAAEYPAKGRATSGVRCHRFRSGEDRLLLAWCGPAPARASSAAGVAVELPAVDRKRDGTGVPLATTVAAVGGPVG